MSSLVPWIQDYIVAMFGKQSSVDKDWDDDKQCLAQITECQSRRGHAIHSGMIITLSDTQDSIKCKIRPKLIGIHGEKSFEKNRIINLKKIELKISASFDSVYFLLMECNFLTSIPVLKVGRNKGITDINKHRMIQQCLKKYRTCLAFTFHPKPGDEQQGFDSNQIPYSLQSQQEESFGFDNEINKLKQIDNNNNIKNGNNNKLQQIDFTQYDLAELCEEEEPQYIHLNDIDKKEEEEKEKKEDDDDDNDEDMVQDDNESQDQYKDKKKKKSSDKEEMEEDEEEDEEKQIIETQQITPGNDDKGGKNLRIKPKFIGNECDWIHDLYPNFDDIPRAIKALKVRPIEKPKHTVSAPAKIKNKKRKQAPTEIISPPKRQRLMASEAKQDEDKDISSGSQNYSQSSWHSNDILEVDRVVERHNMEKQRKEREDDRFEFVQPTYSLRDRYRNNINGRENDSILSVQESVASDVGHTDLSQLIPIQQQQQQQQDEDMEDGMEEDEVDEIEELLADDLDDNDDGNIMNEPIDINFLGLITRNDIDRMHRYFIKVGKQLNKNNNNDPNNPFRVLNK